MNAEDKRYYLVATRKKGETEWKVHGLPLNSLIDAQVYAREKEYFNELYDWQLETKIFVTGAPMPVEE